MILLSLSVCKEDEELTEVIIDVPKEAFRTKFGDPDGSKAKPDSNTPWTADALSVDEKQQPEIEISLTKDGKPLKELVAVEVNGNTKVSFSTVREAMGDMNKK
jgi:hypothetical protein